MSESVHPSAHLSAKDWVPYLAVIAVLVAVIGTGYFGFRTFVTIDPSALNLYGLAVVAGIASFFSPCAFPLLPSYLAFYYEASQKRAGSKPDAGGALPLGLAAALGVVTFAIGLGLLMAALGAGVGESLSISNGEPSQFVRLFRGGIGGILLVLGIGQLAGWNLKPRFVDAFADRTRPEPDGVGRPVRNLYLYGLGYNAAGMGCTGPILAGLMVIGMTSGSFVSALSAFVIFAATMGILMLVVSGLVAASRETLITRLKSATPKIKKTASALLILVGLFNIYTSANVGLFVGLLFP